MSEDKPPPESQPDAMAGLFRIGLEPEAEAGAAGGPEERKEALLRAWLVGPLPTGPQAAGAVCLPAGDFLPLGGDSLGEALLDESTSLETLRRLKDHGKRLAASEQSEAEHAAAVTIYFAAIASALLHHGQRITSYSYPSLAKDFAKLATAAWMAPALAVHFARAQERCVGKAGPSRGAHTDGAPRPIRRIGGGTD